ncbi:MAG: hemerythrin domain-containing protein [Candidatus Sericytochromatia bacterium]
MQIESLVTQHKHMLDMVDRAMGLRPEKDAPAIAAELAKLGAALMAHLETEDKHLYPALRQFGEQPEAPVGLKVNIKNFFDEMEALKPQAIGFLTTWDATAIAARPGEFRDALASLADLLSQRIAREESRLYPLYAEHIPATATR